YLITYLESALIKERSSMQSYITVWKFICFNNGEKDGEYNLPTGTDLLVTYSGIMWAMDSIFCTLGCRICKLSFITIKLPERLLSGFKSGSSMNKTLRLVANRPIIC